MVTTEKNTGPVGFVEKGEETNPHVVRRAPFRVFDAMEPVRASVPVPEPVVALRLQLPVSGRPGPREYKLELHCGIDTRNLIIFEKNPSKPTGFSVRFRGYRRI